VSSAERPLSDATARRRHLVHGAREISQGPLPTLPRKRGRETSAAGAKEARRTPALVYSPNTISITFCGISAASGNEPSSRRGRPPNVKAMYCFPFTA
jgi:hypothetical protein